MALFLNLLIPGAGLIFRGRHWLGLTLAMLFGVSINTAIAGWLVAPVAIPRFYSWTATILSATTWVLAQALLLRRSHPTQQGTPDA